MSEYLYLWHWAPRVVRGSIQARGLRTCSWCMKRLVTHACQLEIAADLRQHVADRHDTVVCALDGWLLRVLRTHVGPRAAGMYLVLTDVGAIDLRGPYPDVVSVESAADSFFAHYTREG